MNTIRRYVFSANTFEGSPHLSPDYPEDSVKDCDYVSLKRQPFCKCLAKCTPENRTWRICQVLFDSWNLLDDHILYNHTLLAQIAVSYIRYVTTQIFCFDKSREAFFTCLLVSTCTHLPRLPARKETQGLVSDQTRRKRFTLMMLTEQHIYRKNKFLNL